MRWGRLGLVTAATVALVVLPVPPTATGGAARWSWPTASHRVVRGFEAPSAPWAAGHRGIDLAARAGDPVRSPADGVVAFAGRLVDRGVVAIDHDGVRSSLEPVEPSVTAGEHVRRGQTVGVLGTGGGHASALHLGARIRVDGDWAYVSPLLLLGGVRRAVLLPLGALP